MTVRTLRNIDVAAREAIEGGEPGVHVHPVRIQDLPKSFQLCLDSVLLRHELLQRKLGLWHSIRVAPRGRSRRDGWRVNVVHRIGQCLCQSWKLPPLRSANELQACLGGGSSHTRAELWGDRGVRVTSALRYNATVFTYIGMSSPQHERAI